MQGTLKRRYFLWSDACESVFQTLKTELTFAPVLSLQRFGEPFQLDTDASNFAVGVFWNKFKKENRK